MNKLADEAKRRRHDSFDLQGPSTPLHWQARSPARDLSYPFVDFKGSCAIEARHWPLEKIKHLWWHCLFRREGLGTGFPCMFPAEVVLPGKEDRLQAPGQHHYDNSSGGPLRLRGWRNGWGLSFNGYRAGLFEIAPFWDQQLRPIPTCLQHGNSRCGSFSGWPEESGAGLVKQEEGALSLALSICPDLFGYADVVLQPEAHRLCFRLPAKLEDLGGREKRARVVGTEQVHRSAGRVCRRPFAASISTWAARAEATTALLEGLRSHGPAKRATACGDRARGLPSGLARSSTGAARTGGLAVARLLPTATPARRTRL